MKGLPEETFLVCATRLGGLHGIPPKAPLPRWEAQSAALPKPWHANGRRFLSRSWDFETTATPAVIATRLIDETLQDPGALEIGWRMTCATALPRWNNPAGGKELLPWNRAAYS